MRCQNSSLSCSIVLKEATHTSIGRGSAAKSVQKQEHVHRKRAERNRPAFIALVPLCSSQSETDDNGLVGRTCTLVLLRLVKSALASDVVTSCPALALAMHWLCGASKARDVGSTASKSLGSHHPDARSTSSRGCVFADVRFGSENVIRLVVGCLTGALEPF